MDKHTWIVVLNWNGRSDTLELLEDIADCGATVLLVDNGSTDGSVGAVSHRFPAVQVLQNGANLGYAGGNNAGIRTALAAGAEVVMVLNNDTVVERGALDPLVAAVRERPLLAVSPDIRYAAEPSISWFRGGRIDARCGLPVHLQPEEQVLGDTLIPTPLLTGCCIAADRSTWNRVGLFDDEMFLIFEDSDWSMRATAKGVHLAVIPASRIAHKVSRSFTGTASLYGSYYYARNGVWFAQRHLGRRMTLRFAFTKVLRPAARAAVKGVGRRAAAMSVMGFGAAIFRRRGPVGPLAIRVAGHG